MPKFLTLVLLVVSHVAVICVCSAQESSFQGEWRLNADRSELHGPFVANMGFLRVTQTRVSLVVMGSERQGGPAISWTYPLDARTERLQKGDIRTASKTKWEGDSLLVNTLISGVQSYAVDERWTRSRDGNTLTVNRTVMRAGNESESILIFENPNAPAPSPAAPTVTRESTADESSRRALTSRPAAPEAPELKQPAAAAPDLSEYVLNPGSRILMRLTNPIDTKHSSVGDRAYFETAVPVFVNRRLVIPARSYVLGTVIESERAGRVKGKSALNIRFDSITLPNGTTRELASRAGSVEGQGDLDRAEGRIKGSSGKGHDAGTVAKTTGVGTGIGSIAGAAAGHAGMGAGIGAAAGALGGLATVLGSRGPDVILRPGTTMEFILDRELRFTDAELVERVH